MSDQTRLGGAVVAVEADGSITAGEVVKVDTPDGWATARRWVKPKGREVVSLVRTTPTATIKLGNQLDTLLAEGWRRAEIDE